MSLPYHLATLLYCFNPHDEVLLQRRTQPPNSGLWSPCGGKVRLESGESPYGGACREAYEEMGLKIEPRDLHLTGVVTERGYQGQGHWLMFLFEVKRRLAHLPPPHREGYFEFFSAAVINELKIPETDREQIWPLFWRHRGGFFSAHCCTRAHGPNQWTLEETSVAGSPNRPSENDPGRAPLNLPFR